MLRIFRRQGEITVITAPAGTEISITVLEFQRNRVVLGFDAPEDCIIDRKEIHERKKREAAAKEVNGNVADEGHEP